MKTLTFVATAHNELFPQRPFVGSMLGQTNPNWKAIEWNNGPSEDGDMPVYNDSRIVYKQSIIDTGNWGTGNRQRAIDECDTDYIIQTSIQDYWLPQAVEYILKGLEQDPDILIWNSVNHLIAPCQVLDSQLAWSKVDWGNFAIRTDIAKKIGVQHGDKYTADWLFIQDVLNSGLVDRNKILKMNALLTIHN